MKKHLASFMACFLLNAAQAQTPDSWTRLADFGGGTRSGAVGFSIDGFGYIGCLGYFIPDSFGAPILNLNDLWQYNPSTNVWSQKANFPGDSGYNGICFTIGFKAYVGLGRTYGGMLLKDFWEYDPSLNTWTRKADFAGGPRMNAIGFSIGNKGYVGLGHSDTAVSAIQDIWEYDPAADTWTRKADFSGGPRDAASAFSIQNVGYIGFGIYGPVNKRDFWQYQSDSDSWVQKADIGSIGRYGSFSFSIGSRGFVGTGGDSSGNALGDFWEYSPLIDVWTEKDSFGGGARGDAVAFSIGNTGYAGIGDNYPTIIFKDFWEYTPDSIYYNGIKEVDIGSIGISPNPATDILHLDCPAMNFNLTISDMTGRQWAVSISNNDIDISALSAGVYCLHIQNKDGTVVRKFVKE